MTVNQETCQKCGSPVRTGMKFCESCGAKIGASPVCTQCGAPVAPNAKFCESCGASVSPAAVPAPPVPETPPGREVKPPEVIPVKAEESPASAPVEKPVPPAPPVKREEEAAPAPVLVKDTSRTEKTRDQPKETGAKKPMPRQALIIAAIIVLAVLGAAVYFIVLPMLSGPGTLSQIAPQTQVTTSPGSSSAAPAAAVDTSPAASVSLTTGPTQVPPYNRMVVVDVDRDAITSLITVTFQGGEGQYGVRELVVTLTRSDGTVETKSFKPENRDDSVTLQGTPKTDRVEVTANFYSGESYKIIDRIFEYKKRGG